MTRTELEDLIRIGETSGVEFKRDEIENYRLAEVIVGFANTNGGVILLGVADDGRVQGTTRDNIEEWVVELCRTKIDPPIVPYLEWHREFSPGKDILVVRVLRGPFKAYSRLHNNRRNYFIRVGTTTREASPDELERLFQASGRLRYGSKPVPGATFSDLDLRRLKDYFGRVLSQAHPSDTDVESWQRLLVNLEFMVRTDDVVAPTIDGMLLFGLNPRRFLPQSGIRALAFPGVAADYAAWADSDLSGPMLPLGFRNDAAGQFVLESGLVEQALDFVRRNTELTSGLAGGIRVDRPAYPPEVIVNALVHRDYSIASTDIMLTVFSDRLEVRSPGHLPNTATVEAIKAGYRYARNQTLVNVMRDYHYVEFRGMGIKDKVIPGMRRHNGTEPDFIETEYDFTVRLWKEKKP